MMRTVAVIPLRGLTDGKSRLSAILPDRVRRALIGALLERVVRAVQASGCIATTVVISPDPDILHLAGTLQVVPLQQTNTGLNAALWQATNWARDQRYDALFAIHADLPLITAQSIRDITQRATADVVVISDRHAHGTNALFMRPVGATTFHFGEQSFTRHLAASEARGLRTVPYQTAALSFDLDLPADVAMLAVFHPLAFFDLCCSVRRWLPRVPRAQPTAPIAHPVGEGQQ